MGLYFSENEDFDRALENIKKAIARDSRSPHYFQAFVNVSERSKQFAAAEAALKDIAGKEPADFAPLYGLAFLRYKQGKRDEALSDLDRAIRVDPDEPLAYRLKCDVLADNGQHKEMLALALDKVKLAEGRYPTFRSTFTPGSARR